MTASPRPGRQPADPPDVGPRAPNLTPQAAAAQAARAERQAAALRANLRRRKDQARARETTQSGGQDEPD